MIQFSYVLAAIAVFLWGMRVVNSHTKDKALSMLIGFVVASMAAPISDSLFVWAVELILIIILINKRTQVNLRLSECRIYIIFLIWVVFTLSYTDNIVRGFRGLMMYIFPLFYYALSVLAFRTIDDINRFFNNVNKSSPYFVVLGLFAMFVGQFSTIQVYYGMSICVIPFTLYIKDKKKKSLLFLILCSVPSVLLIKRTPLLGMAIAISIYAILIYKAKALVPIFVSIVASLILVISIPQFRDKLFFGGGDMTLMEISKNQDVGDNINTSGRNVFWAYLFDKYVSQSPFVGAGVGSVKAFVQSDKNEYKESFFMVHNDWLLILCEMGLVGVSLLLSFFISVFIKCKKYASKRYPRDVRLVSAACAGSLLSTMMHMFFENCMNSFIFPTFFIFYALFNVYIKDYKNKLKIIKYEKEASNIPSPNCTISD